MKHLTLADEIVVLMLRDDTGAIRTECASVAGMAIACGILMELTLLGRIDTDLKSLFIVDPTPVGDELLDNALQKIAAEPQTRSSAWWIRVLGLHSGDLSGKVLRRLVQAGILRAEDRQFLWVFSRRAYPQNSGREEREAKARLLSVIFNDDLPDARDTLLLGHRRPRARHHAGERSGSARLLVIAVGTDRRLAAVAGRCRRLHRRRCGDRLGVVIERAVKARSTDSVPASTNSA